MNWTELNWSNGFWLDIKGFCFFLCQFQQSCLLFRSICSCIYADAKSKYYENNRLFVVIVVGCRPLQTYGLMMLYEIVTRFWHSVLCIVGFLVAQVTFKFQQEANQTERNKFMITLNIDSTDFVRLNSDRHTLSIHLLQTD